MNLKAAIKLRGLTQWELCVQVGGDISPSFLSDLIAGRRQAGDLLRRRLAGLLNADPDWLFENLNQIPLPGKQEARPGTGHPFQNSTRKEMNDCSND